MRGTRSTPRRRDRIAAGLRIAVLGAAYRGGVKRDGVLRGFGGGVSITELGGRANRSRPLSPTTNWSSSVLCPTTSGNPATPRSCRRSMSSIGQCSGRTQARTMLWTGAAASIQLGFEDHPARRRSLRADRRKLDSEASCYQIRRSYTGARRFHGSTWPRARRVPRRELYDNFSRERGRRHSGRPPLGSRSFRRQSWIPQRLPRHSRTTATSAVRRNRRNRHGQP